jgi:triosephosphate isomerase (TIM)
MARRKFVVGNWKMNGLRADLGEARAIAAVAASTPSVDVALCPPATLLIAMCEAVPGLLVGGQDCRAEPKGAFTGSISAAMLADTGAGLVLVGHSERREGFGESDAVVRAKAEAALAAGLSVIICVGESLKVREAGAAEAHVLAQVAGSLPAMDSAIAARLAIAYEPIWAIGTGRTATLADIAIMHGAIRGTLGEWRGVVRLLYGGSVTPDNAAEILTTSDVDGALVGGASLTAAKFMPIIAAAAG